ncbi:MAG TPA: ATP synthase F1 subunit delta [Candidatus Dormibacteraeota bacterium]|nr:ATP synthase F1 subunit delta [Candidatus Dormibacteraeota bacterium]
MDEWSRRLTKVRDLFAAPEVAAVLSNRSIPATQRDALIATAPHLFDQEATNLARLLVESGRIHEAAEIHSEFERLADDAAGRVRATVTTAVELESEDRDRIEKRLSRRLNKEVRLTLAVDPRIIGGLKLQYGDRVIDASVATRLQQLRRRLAAT